MRYIDTYLYIYLYILAHEAFKPTKQVKVAGKKCRFFFKQFCSKLLNNFAHCCIQAAVAIGYCLQNIPSNRLVRYVKHRMPLLKSFF